ncbi:ricin-type beta-trefoil lectin domain protein [Streptomyces sp. CA-135486]|uniref:ricin-type beta-trefoil lectin domain protein n=1 Tax=Streptomyces sp. CA-135486 TaxID=3240049 RepID=UPI003D92D372
MRLTTHSPIRRGHQVSGHPAQRLRRREPNGSSAVARGGRRVGDGRSPGWPGGAGRGDDGLPGSRSDAAIVRHQPGGLSGYVPSGLSGKCLDACGNSGANGTRAALWTCNGSAAQFWTAHPDGTLRINGGCLDVAGGIRTGDLDMPWRRETSSGSCAGPPGVLGFGAACSFNGADAAVGGSHYLCASLCRQSP